jgi:hypothetical protein
MPKPKLINPLIIFGNNEYLSTAKFAWRAEQALIFSEKTGPNGSLLQIVDNKGIKRITNKVDNTSYTLLSQGQRNYGFEYDFSRKAIFFRSGRNHYLATATGAGQPTSTTQTFAAINKGNPFYFAWRGEWTIAPAESQSLLSTRFTGPGLYWGANNSYSDDLTFIVTAENLSQYRVQTPIDTEPHTWAVYSDGSLIIFEQDGVQVDTVAVSAKDPTSQSTVNEKFGAFSVPSTPYYVKNHYWYGCVFKDGYVLDKQERDFWKNWLEVPPRPEQTTIPLIQNWEADSGISVSDGDPVDTWESTLSEGLDLTNIGIELPTFRATAATNGLPSVEFGGTKYLRVELSKRQPTTFILIADVINTTSNTHFFDSFAATGRNGFYRTVSSRYSTHGPGLYEYLNIAISTGLHFYAVVFNGLNSFIQVDGVRDVGSSTDSTFQWYSLEGGITLGSRFNFVNGVSMYLHSFSIYDGVLSTADLVSLRAAAQTKWSVP